MTRRSRPRAPQTYRAIAVVSLGAVTLAGCAGPGADQAGAAASTFAEQASASPEKACALLSEQAREELEKSSGAPCAEALADLGLPPGSDRVTVDVYEQHARVVLADDVLFLARFADGWKVTAAGCEPQPDDKPYDCEIGG